MIDKHSDTWREVAAWADSELAKASQRIESVGVDLQETENLRGSIRTLRELLAIQEEPAEFIIGKVEDYGFQGSETD